MEVANLIVTNNDSDHGVSNNSPLCWSSWSDKQKWFLRNRILAKTSEILVLTDGHYVNFTDGRKCTPRFQFICIMTRAIGIKLPDTEDIVLFVKFCTDSSDLITFKCSLFEGKNEYNCRQVGFGLSRWSIISVMHSCTLSCKTKFRVRMKVYRYLHVWYVNLTRKHNRRAPSAYSFTIVGTIWTMYPNDLDLKIQYDPE